jgi:hypothetical protein
LEDRLQASGRLACRNCSALGAALELRRKKFRHRALETLTQFDSPAHDLGCQFRIRRKGDVLLLNYGIDSDLPFLGLLAVQINR